MQHTFADVLSILHINWPCVCTLNSVRGSITIRTGILKKFSLKFTNNHKNCQTYPNVMFTLVPLGPSIRSPSLDVLEHKSLRLELKLGTYQNLQCRLSFDINLNNFNCYYIFSIEKIDFKK
ncbi:hypothetical protein BpHYR1_018839 [Brachionus plicatilis]|uniref:Uncharacterized protein n=1 Tax=Brachionus plicatilis TaxID=10195 RepID=A0A3M7QR35_BRAPC|nr:hypothetical protein BpHYR1_018839 [Brachionus plicatilis]